MGLCPFLFCFLFLFCFFLLSAASSCFSSIFFPPFFYDLFSPFSSFSCFFLLSLSTFLLPNVYPCLSLLSFLRFLLQFILCFDVSVSLLSDLRLGLCFSVQPQVVRPFRPFRFLLPPFRRLCGRLNQLPFLDGGCFSLSLSEALSSFGLVQRSLSTVRLQSLAPAPSPSLSVSVQLPLAFSVFVSATIAS